MGQHYVIVADAGKVRRILRLISRFESEGRLRTYTVALFVYAEDPRILGGIKRIDKDSIIILKGVLVPSLKA